MFEHMLYSDDHSAGSIDSALDAHETAARIPLGRRAFIAGTVGAVAATAVNSSAHAAVPSGASYYKPIGPVRLADTRRYAPYVNESKNFQRLNDRKIRLDILNSPYISVPSGAVAVVVSIAAIFNGPVPYSPGWVKAVPAGTTTEVSNINMEYGDTAVANLATVRIGPGGKIDVQGQFPYDVVVDILGVYVATSVAVRAGRLEFLAATRRALTFTRMTTGSWRTVKLSFVPTSAQAVVVNLTVDQCRTAGFLTALGQRTVGPPKVSNLNHGANETRAAGAIVKLGQTNGVASIEIYSHGDSNAIVDVTAYITSQSNPASEEGLFVPINPTRVMDTRRAADFARTGKKRLWPGWTRAFELPNSTGGFGQRTQMKGVAMNATLVTAMQLGFVTVLPAQTDRNEVSNLNAARNGHIVANHVISQASTKGVEMFAFCGGDVIADVAGWYVGPPKQATNANATLDQAVPKAPFNWFLSVPRMGLQNFVVPSATGDPVVDVGNSWHWTGTGQLGEDNRAIVVFGHRTSAGGPYRYQHNLVAGDRLYLDTPDQRRYEYSFVREKLTGDATSTILNTSRTNASTPSFTLVACTGTRYVFNDQPLGGIRYRIISTFALVKWTDMRPNEG